MNTLFYPIAQFALSDDAEKKLTISSEIKDLIEEEEKTEKLPRLVIFVSLFNFVNQFLYVAFV